MLLTPAEYGKGLDPIMTLSEYLISSKDKHSFSSDYLPRAEVAYENGTPIIFRFDSVEQINLWLIKKPDNADFKFTSFGQLKNQTANLRLIPEDGIFKSLNGKSTFQNEFDLIKAFNANGHGLRISSHYVSSEKESCESTTGKHSESCHSEKDSAINVHSSSNEPIDNELDQYQDSQYGTSGNPVLPIGKVVEFSDHSDVVETDGQTDKDTKVSDVSDSEREEIIHTEGKIGQPTEHTQYGNLENLELLLDDHRERKPNVDQMTESLNPNAKDIECNFDISDEKIPAQHELESCLSTRKDMHQLQMPTCKQDQEDLHSVNQIIESLNTRDFELFDQLHLKNNDQEDYLNDRVELVGIKDLQVIKSVDQGIEPLKALDTELFDHFHAKDEDQEDHLDYFLKPVGITIQDQQDLQSVVRMIESPKARDVEIFDHLHGKDKAQEDHLNDLQEPVGIQDQQELPPVDQIIKSLKARDIELFDHLYVKNQEIHGNDHGQIPVNRMLPDDPLKKEDMFAGDTILSEKVKVKDMDQGDGQGTVIMDQILPGDNFIRNSLVQCTLFLQAKRKYF